VKLASFDFHLPEHLIAQHPAPERDRARLMVVRRQSGTVEHRNFYELPEILDSKDFLVVNTTKVFPARLWAHRPGKQERIEVLLVREESPSRWIALVRPARKAGPGQQLQIGDIRGSVDRVLDDGSRTLAFPDQAGLRKTIESLGEPPLPPYIKRMPGENLAEDRERYQTVFAQQSGSIAAPTAALHFSPRVLEQLSQKGIPCCEILLHVGYGTFQPVRTDNIEDHRMHPEYFEVGATAAAEIAGYKESGRRLIAVGTTATRVLEHLARSGRFSAGQSSGYCNLFIYPGFQFHALDGLITNFHLPCSTLFMLVCAFAGREFMLDCYKRAIAENYRFFSYGDCMLIL
jgi:S-adenosylmethionine:tRNA ribosyltransferase-isomerase